MSQILLRTDLEVSGNAPSSSLTDPTDEVEEQHHMPQKKQQHLTVSE